MTTNLHDKMLAAIDAYFSASNEIEAHIAEEQLLDVRDEINKHKLAAESLNEGLRLDDWDKIGCVNHDCDKCKAQQEPLTDIYRSFEQWKNGNVLEHGMPRTEYYSEAQLDLVEMGWKYGYDAGLAEQPAQQEPKATNQQIIEWADRHDLQGTMTDLRSAFEDAKTVYTTTAPQAQPAREPLIQVMVESCPYYGEGMREAYFDGWTKAEAAHGITKGNT